MALFRPHIHFEIALLQKSSPQKIPRYPKKLNGITGDWIFRDRVMTRFSSNDFQFGRLLISMELWSIERIPDPIVASHMLSSVYKTSLVK